MLSELFVVKKNDAYFAAADEILILYYLCLLCWSAAHW